MSGQGAGCATYDSMTGLRDRMTFFADANKSAAEGSHSYIILMQLSQLMRVNRKYGASVGDRLLRSMADYLNTVDKQFTAYRIANSRMVLLGQGGSREQVQVLAERIQRRLQEGWLVERKGEMQEVMVKTMVIYFPLSHWGMEGGRSMEGNRSMEEGRSMEKGHSLENDIIDKMNYAVSVFDDRAVGGVLFFNEELNTRMLHQRYVMEEVRYAVEHKTFQIYYQPIYDCNDKRFTSAESLIRLFARDGSFISPGEFIPMAEESGLIDEISWIVLEKVCQFLGRYPRLQVRTISVNLTGQQIVDPSFVRRIEENLAKYCVDGSRLRIEITERTVMDDFAEVRKVMECLAEKGIHFYLDDFGTGYSNLSSMLELPFEVIKFDQSLMRIMNDAHKGQRTIGLLADIMHENNYRIVAEGIETALQVKNAHERKLDRIQGFYFAKPMPEGELVAFLEKGE